MGSQWRYQAPSPNWMPIELERNDLHRRFESADYGEIGAVLDPVVGGEMDAAEISPRVYNPTNDPADVIHSSKD